MTDHNPYPFTEPFEQRPSLDSMLATAPVGADDDTADTHRADIDAASEDSEPIDLLHVEPDRRSADLLKSFATHSPDPIAVRSVRGLEAALRAVADADCVVTEHRLPDGSGAELVERLRRDGESLPVVFHTTCRDDEAEARASDVGADAYFEKRSQRGQHKRLLRRVRTLVRERDSRAPVRTTSVED